MTTTMSSPAKRPALLHPVFLGALALLVVNDHVLKGSGLAPGWLTGKLSDFAGLVVAPVVLATLVRARSQRALAFVHGAVALGFALTEISQPVADLVTGALGALGLRSAMRADLGDLVALAILPLPFALLRAASPGVIAAEGVRASGRGDSSLSRVAPRVSFGLAMFACIGSPQPAPPASPMWITSAYLVNRTSTERNVRLSWVGASLDCARLSEMDAPSLTRAIDPSVLGDAVTFRLQPGETVPIEEITARAGVAATGASADAGPTSDAGTPSGATSVCEVVLLRSEGLLDTLVFIGDRTSTFAVPSSLAGQPNSAPDEAVELRAAPDAAWNIGIALRSATLAAHPEPTTCGPERASIATSFDGRSAARRIASVEVGVDGCLDVTLEAATTLALEDVFLCGVPRDMFPFDVDDQVMAAPAADGFAILDPAPNGRRIAVHRGTRSVNDGAFVLTLSSPEACNGVLLACGGFVEPSAVTLAPAIAGDDLSGIVTRTDALGRRVRILVGRAENVVVGPSRCDPDRAAAGPHVSMVVTYDLL